MKTNVRSQSPTRSLIEIISLAAVPVILLMIASCSSSSDGDYTSTSTFQQGVPGGVVVDTYKLTANVTAVDHDKRLITLTTPDGKKTTVKAGPEVKNFDQIRVGDRVSATVTEQLVVYLHKVGTPGISQSTTVALAPKGEKPGVVIANAVEIIAVVSAVDLKQHKATLSFPNGESRTVKVRDDVDLKTVSTGDRVVIRATESIALHVEKP